MASASRIALVACDPAALIPWLIESDRPVICLFMISLPFANSPFVLAYKKWGGGEAVQDMCDVWLRFSQIPVC